MKEYDFVRNNNLEIETYISKLDNFTNNKKCLLIWVLLNVYIHKYYLN